MSALVIIPARYGSTRFPGKPLRLIAGKTMIRRVFEIAAAGAGRDCVMVATDDKRIFEHVSEFGGQAVMTGEGCRNGTERVHDALKRTGKTPEIIVNMQGDTPLTPPWFIRDLIQGLKASPDSPMATLSVGQTLADYESAKQRLGAAVPSGTYVVCDNSRHALYFSRFPIPYLREIGSGPPPFFKHIGIYAYRPESLEQYLKLPPSALEIAEGLEQLRALQNGMRILVVQADPQGRTMKSVDSPEDAARVEEIIAAEGELLC